MMTNEQVRARLALVTPAECKREVFIGIYGIDLWDRASEAAGMFRVWAANLTQPLRGLHPDSADRWLFERFLLQHDLVPAKIAAVQFAMSEGDFVAVLKAMAEASLIPAALQGGEVSGLYSSRFLRDLPKRLPSFPRKTYASESTFIRDFHAAAGHLLGRAVRLILCSASTALDEKPAAVAYEYDIITSEPIGLGHQVWLDFGKPIALKPDACSIMTYARHEAVLEEYCMSQPATRPLADARLAVQREHGKDE